MATGLSPNQHLHLLFQYPLLVAHQSAISGVLMDVPIWATRQKTTRPSNSIDETVEFTPTQVTIIVSAKTG